MTSKPPSLNVQLYLVFGKFCSTVDELSEEGLWNGRQREERKRRRSPTVDGPEPLQVSVGEDVGASLVAKTDDVLF